MVHDSYRREAIRNPAAYQRSVKARNGEKPAAVSAFTVAVRAQQAADATRARRNSHKIGMPRLSIQETDE